MKYSYRIIIGLMVALALPFAIAGVVNAQSTPLSNEQLARIVTNCVSAKNTLNQLHASDALLRVNRGQAYVSISSRLMTRFNNRVETNSYDAKDLTSATQNYDNSYTAFYASYKAYEEQLSLALRIDCTKQPAEFYQAVASARTKRTQVHTDVVRLHQNIDDYSAAFATFSTDFTSRGVNN